MESIEKRVQRLKECNAAYRSGSPFISDHAYDQLVEELRGLDPGHPFLHTVEPETLGGRTQVRHPIPMLSTEKAYTNADLARFFTRVGKAAAELKMADPLFRVTPKLDGLAGRDDGRIFASRGNGETGFEISSAFTKGVIPIGGRGLGVGEIVIVKSYFEKHLAGEFEHPRNMVVGIISSDTVNESAQKALADQAVHFVPYVELPDWVGTGEELLDTAPAISADLISETDYPVDGVVAEVVSVELRQFMGATHHHNRWQIAIKTRGETAFTVVENIVWQVGRTGNVTPVMVVRPASLSGATIRRVTAHHAGMIKEKSIGIGSRIEIIRSGEVIPKLEKVITPADHVVMPSVCPACNSPLEWRNDFLKCLNPECRAQIEQNLLHWFKTLGTADWFGIKTIEKLVDGGYDSLEKIYGMILSDFLALGFGPVQSKNLVQAIDISRTRRVEDWRFLAAMGIPDLGRGESRKLLAHFTLEDIVDVTAEGIEQINGFGAVSSSSITVGIARRKTIIAHLLALGFNLERTPLIAASQIQNSPITGKGVVFTGKMRHGTRDDMQAAARNLGARVQTAVSSKTDYLVCGEKVGARKLEKAAKAGVQVMTEDEYGRLIELKSEK
jgi:DNA ligase (NAD+)